MLKDKPISCSQISRMTGVVSGSVANIPARRFPLDPFAYLRDIFERISSHPQSRFGELLPDQWKTARQPAPTS
jgi:hypothetical protein